MGAQAAQDGAWLWLWLCLCLWLRRRCNSWARAGEVSGTWCGCVPILQLAKAWRGCHMRPR